MKNNLKVSSGFNIIELMIAVSIIGILAVTAIPVYSDFVLRQNVRSSGKVLNKTLASARVEAITSDQSSSVVCWNLTGASIPFLSAATGENIASGEIVIARGDLTAITEIVSVTQILSSGQSLVVRDNDADNCVTFDSQGRLGGSTESPLGFLLCRNSGDGLNSSRVEVSNAGRSTVKLNTNTTGWGVQDC